MLGLATLVGSEPMFVDAEEHDIYAAAVSHLPLVISTALFSMLRSSPAWPDMGMMASSGFRDITRLASGDPAMSHGIWVTNREAIIHWVERVMDELRRFRDMLKDAQDEALLETFFKAQADREAYLRDPPRRSADAAVVGVDSGEALLSMLVGGMMAKHLQRAKELSEPKKEAGEEGSSEPASRPSFGKRVAEGVQRDLEKLERERAEKQAAGELGSGEDEKK